MDNFMDKLSKRFNAGEIIQANGEAEAKENERMKHQISEYERIIQDVRRMSLKTAEMSEQASQLLASGIEQIEAYENQRLQMELKLGEAQEQNDSAKEALYDVSDGLSEMKANISGMKGDISTMAGRLSGVADTLSFMNGNVSGAAEQISGVTGSITGMTDMLSEMADNLSEMTDHLSGVKGEMAGMSANLSGTTAEISGISDDVADFKAELSGLQESLQRFLSANEAVSEKLAACNDNIQKMQSMTADDLENRLSGISLRIDNTEALLKREVSDATYRVEASISEMRQLVLQGSGQNRQAEELLARTAEGFEQIAREHRQLAEKQETLEQTLASLSETQEENFKQTKEMVVNLRLYLDEVEKNIEDYVHKEDVKVYRNVQANFAEQMTNRFRDVGDQLGSLDRDVSKNSGSKALLIITFLTAAAGLAVQVLQMLGLL